MKAVVEEYAWDHDTTGRRIIIDLEWFTEEYADEIRRGVQSYLDLIEELETE